MQLYEWRELLKNDEQKAIDVWNEQFKKGLDTTSASKEVGFSWTSISKELLSLGYQKPKNKLICRIGEVGESVIINKEPKTKFSEEEIIFLKELYKNRVQEEEKEVRIESFGDIKQKTLQISERLLKEIDELYKKEEYQPFKKQDFLNTIIKKGLESFKK